MDAFKNVPDDSEDVDEYLLFTGSGNVATLDSSDLPSTSSHVRLSVSTWKVTSLS